MDTFIQYLLAQAVRFELNRFSGNLISLQFLLDKFSVIEIHNIILYLF